MSFRSFIANAAAATLSTALLSGAASAANITVDNFSFESTVTSSYQTVSSVGASQPPNNNFVTPSADTVVPGWGFVFGAASNPAASSYWSGGNQTLAQASLTGGDGTQAGDVNGGSDLMYQDVGSISSNTTYTLTVAVAQPPSGKYGNNAADLATVALANGAVSSSGTYAVLPTVNSANESTFTPAAGALTDETVTLTTGAGATGDLTILLENATPITDATGAAIQSQINFDNVRLTSSAVPEPAPFALLLAAAGAVCLLRRRKTSMSA